MNVSINYGNAKRTKRTFVPGVQIKKKEIRKDGKHQRRQITTIQGESDSNAQINMYHAKFR